MNSSLRHRKCYCNGNACLHDISSSNFRRNT